MAWCEIPLNNAPYSEQTFKLNLEGGAKNIYIKLVLRYHDLYDLWTASVTNNATGEVLIDTLPLVPGVDLLGQYQYLEIGHAYIVAATDTDLMQPDNTTLGSAFLLIWGDAS